MGLFSGLFGPSENVTRTRPQVMEGLEPLVPHLSNLAQKAYGRPYQAYGGGARIAPFSGSQQAGMNAIRGIASDPSYRRGLGQAGEAIGSSMEDQDLQSMIRSLGRSIKPERTGTQRWTSPGVADSYMSPYKANVIDQYLNREDKRTGERRAGLDAKLAGKRAFGSRGDIARTNFESDEEDRKAEAIANLLDKGYESGASRFAADEDRGLTSSTGNANRALSAEQLMTQGIGQGITGENTRLAGRRAAGNDLSSLTERYRTGNLDNARAVMNVGQMEQTQAQRPLDLQYQDWTRQQNFPAEQATGLSRIVYGAPTGTTTTTPGPSGASQLLGAGIGIAGLGSGMGWWADGGEVKRFADGGAEDGISDDDLLAMLNDPDTDDVTKESIRERLRMSDRAPAGIGIAMPSGGPPAGPMTPDMRMGREDAMPPVPMSMPPQPPPVVAAPASEPPGEAAADPYSGLLAKLVEAQDPKASRGMILAKLGAAMASSRNPSFLGAVGEGIGAGAKGIEDDKARRLRALGTAANIEERRQTGKERAEDRKRADKIRQEDLASRAEDRKAALGLREQQLAAAQQRVEALIERQRDASLNAQARLDLARQIAEAREAAAAAKQALAQEKEDSAGFVTPKQVETEVRKAIDNRFKALSEAHLGAMTKEKAAELQSMADAYGEQVRKGLQGNLAPRYRKPAADDVSRETPSAVSPPAALPPAAPSPAAAQPGAILPLPKDKAQLKAGGVYQTARGPARWNGTAFVPAGP